MVKWLQYSFEVYQQGGDWNEVGGIYIFCGLSPQNRWVPIYIGQADSFRSRIPSHEQWNQAVQLGATHVHALVIQQAANRAAIERELIQAYQPALNTHHR